MEIVHNYYLGNMDDDDDILKKINGAKEQFYNNNQKNSFFKKQQKFDCASSIMSGLNATEVFSNIFIVKDDIMFFNYPVFKTVAHPNIYELISDYIFEISSKLIEQYGSYKLCLNCTGITVSAIERYKEFVRVVSNKGLNNGTALLSKMTVLQIHNPPSFVDYGMQVLIPLVDNSLWNKIQIMK